MELMYSRVYWQGTRCVVDEKYGNTLGCEDLITSIPSFTRKLVDKLMADYQKPEDIIGENGLLKQLTKAVLERALQAEMADHLGYEKHDPAGHDSGNYRNGSYEPKIVGNGQTRSPVSMTRSFRCTRAG